MKNIRFVGFVLLIFCASNSFSQITVELGDAEEVNPVGGFAALPAPYASGDASARHQMLIRAEELIDQGAVMGEILSLSFNVQNAIQTEDLDNFVIRIGNTDLDELTSVYQTGLTPVTNPVDYSPNDGWNTHDFDTPFMWDGVSNFIIETCFNGFGFTQHSQTWRTELDFTATISAGVNNGNACNFNQGFVSFLRPDMRLEIMPTNVPPIADFSASTTTTCSGTVAFEDLSSFDPNMWLWDFGDMNTSDEESPIHTYTSNGVYDVSLIVWNDWGTDTIVYENLITVNLGSLLPVAANCIPTTSNGDLGFGITQVGLNSLLNNTGDASNGYEDFTCLNTTLIEGETYDLAVSAVGPADSHVAAWIDFNNSGSFEEDEMIFNEVFNGDIVSSITIPGSAELDTPLRLRVSGDFYILGSPSPCGPYQSGQGEDYTIIIESNLEPPVAAFSADETLSCDGTVQFYDESENLPDSWLWDFGDTETSFLPNPEHTYASSGIYTVTLTVFNGNGNDMLVATDYILVDLDQQLIDPVCTPQVIDYCCEYGITLFEFDNEISVESENAEEGYRDFSCGNVAIFNENEEIEFFVGTSQENPQDTKIWIDFNNDGDFTADELIVEETNQFNPSGTVIINDSPILETKLRMRVSSDVVGANLNGCADQTFGQTEDYAVIINPALMPPIPDFTGFPLYSCDGVVQFTDLSGNNPDEWFWEFGDNNTSEDPNPEHTYDDEGIYSVTLTVTNDDGSSAVTFSGYVIVDFDLPCNIVSEPENDELTTTECSGMLLDSGEFEDYLLNNESSVTIDLSNDPNVEAIELNFLSFAYSLPNAIEIYDGLVGGGNLIGAYSGNFLPNGGTVISSGPIISIRELVGNTNPNSGFVATWNCLTVGIDEFEIDSDILVSPNPVINDLILSSESGNWVTPIIELRDIHGRMIKSYRSNQIGYINEQLNLSDIASGIYILRIKDDERTVHKKFVKR